MVSTGNVNAFGPWAFQMMPLYHEFGESVVYNLGRSLSPKVSAIIRYGD